MPLPYQFTELNNISQQNIEAIFEKANDYKNDLKKTRNKSIFQLLKGTIVANLFFEPSTRTLLSFTTAAQRLGAIILSPDLKHSAISKGESDEDTIRTIQKLGASILVIRHPAKDFLSKITPILEPTTRLINAGNGESQHPTQALIDLFTIAKYKNCAWHDLHVTIVGDIMHSRVAHSLMTGLLMMGVKQIDLVGPANFLPAVSPHPSIHLSNSLENSLHQSDFAVTLRLQEERRASKMTSQEKESFRDHFGLTKELLIKAHSNALIMHPGPVNRGIEIDSELIDSDRSLIYQQVENGVPVRMAILDLLYNT